MECSAWTIIYINIYIYIYMFGFLLYITIYIILYIYYIYYIYYILYIYIYILYILYYYINYILLLWIFWFLWLNPKPKPSIPRYPEAKHWNGNPNAADTDPDPNAKLMLEGCRGWHDLKVKPPFFWHGCLHIIYLYIYIYISIILVYMYILYIRICDVCLLVI